MRPAVFFAEEVSVKPTAVNSPPTLPWWFHHRYVNHTTIHCIRVHNLMLFTVLSWVRINMWRLMLWWTTTNKWMCGKHCIEKHVNITSALLLRGVMAARVKTEFELFCRPLMKYFLCLLITLNGNLGFFCTTDNCTANCYHWDSLINESSRISSTFTASVPLWSFFFFFLRKLAILKVS